MYINGTAPLEESIGYLASSDELVYVGIFSLLGSSTTEPYTLNFSITTDFRIQTDRMYLAMGGLTGGRIYYVQRINDQSVRNQDV